MFTRRILPHAAALCVAASAAAQSPFQGLIDRWQSQDLLNPPPRDAVVFVGSSSIRYWEQLARDFAHYDVIQRGFGGSQFSDLNPFVVELVTSHDPSAVVVFEGTNDLNSGKTPAVVFDDYLTFVDLVHQEQNPSKPPTPILFIGVTPTPARWAGWPEAEQLNALVEAHVQSEPALFYLDIPTPFLARGMPPPSSLFVADRLHLNQAGYDIWTSVIRPGLEAALPPARSLQPNPTHPRPGERILVDFGPSNAADGRHTGGPDANGHHWNDWHGMTGGGAVVAGEHLGDLVTTAGVPTGIDLIITGQFSANGIQNGGLLAPDPSLLGDLAVASATEDYFFGDNVATRAGFRLTGLDPSYEYELRFFSTRATGTTQVTRFHLVGRDRRSFDLLTSGTSIGSAGGDGNDDTILTVTFVPDEFGQAFVDVERVAGNFSYLGVLEVVVTRDIERDGDGDGVPDLTDCDRLDGDAWAAPGEVPDYRLSHDRVAGITTHSWGDAGGGQAPGQRHDIVASTDPSDFVGALATCVAVDEPSRAFFDSTPPPVGGVQYLLVLAENACDRGGAGARSDAVTLRSVRACP